MSNTSHNLEIRDLRLLENILQRCLAENFSNLKRAIMQNPCMKYPVVEFFLMEIAGINSRLATLAKRGLDKGGLAVNTLDLSQLLQ